MNTSIAQFMKIALTVVVISALLFLVGYRMVDTKVRGDNGYQSVIEKPTINTQAAHPFTN